MSNNKPRSQSCGAICVCEQQPALASDLSDGCTSSLDFSHRLDLLNAFNTEAGRPGSSLLRVKWNEPIMLQSICNVDGQRQRIYHASATITLINLSMCQSGGLPCHHDGNAEVQSVHRQQQQDKARDMGALRPSAVSVVLHRGCVHTRGSTGHITFAHLKVKRAHRIRGSLFTSQATLLSAHFTVHNKRADMGERRQYLKTEDIRV